MHRSDAVQRAARVGHDAIHAISGRVEAPADTDLEPGGIGVVSANDSLKEFWNNRGCVVTRRAYATRSRVALVAQQISQRDRAILADIRRLNIASGQQLRRLHYADTDTGKRMARLELARLTQLRAVARLERRVGGVRAGSDGYVYALDTLGQRLLEPERRRYRSPWTPQPHHLRHALAVSELYVRLREAERGMNAHIEVFDTEPSCWRSFTGPGGSRIVLKPDAFAVVSGQSYEDHWFVELDCATESSPRIVSKAKLYARYWQSGREQASSGLFPGVLWVAPSERRRNQIVRAIATLPADTWQLFVITTLDVASGLILSDFVGLGKGAAL